MAVYRFRVSFEEYDEITRDIEIKSNQTFEEFLTVILQSISFDNKHAASFFVSDDYWRKNQEITLMEEDMEDGTRLMKNTKIASFVDTPYQRFILLYDKKVQWSFLIELIKIEAEDNKVTYPVCTKKHGNPPKQYKNATIENKVAKPEDALGALLGGLDEEEEEDEAAYKSADTTEMGIDEGDLDFAQSEEGEEESSEEGEEGSDEGGDEEEYGFGQGEEEDY